MMEYDCDYPVESASGKEVRCGAKAIYTVRIADDHAPYMAFCDEHTPKVTSIY